MVRYSPNAIAVRISHSRGLVPVRLYTYDDIPIAGEDDEMALKKFADVIDTWTIHYNYILLAAWLVKEDEDSDKRSILSFTSYDEDIRSLECNDIDTAVNLIKRKRRGE